MTALSDLPSNAYTSALYFSFAYRFASANCAWWNTLDRSDTKNAIFIGFFDCSPEPLANAIGARSASATSSKIAFFIFSLLFRMKCMEPVQRTVSDANSEAQRTPSPTIFTFLSAGN